MYKVVEKDNPLRIHACCDTKESAEFWVKVLAPDYASRGFFTDKTLSGDSFTVVTAGNKKGAEID